MRIVKSIVDFIVRPISISFGEPVDQVPSVNPFAIQNRSNEDITNRLNQVIETRG